MSNETKAARDERNRYQREWRARNKERVKQINERYWMKRAAKAAAEREVQNGNGKDRA